MQTMPGLTADIDFVAAPPRVFVVGSTMPRPDAFEAYLSYRGEKWTSIDSDELNRTDPATVSEWAGRVCYMSFSNAKSRVRERYLQDSIMAHAHGSVIEHVSFNLLCADVARDIQLEFVRHRAGTGYSWESTRFTDKHLRFVVPPRLRETPEAMEIFKTGILRQVEAYEELRRLAESEGDEGTLKRKRMKEAARGFLPGCRASDGMITLNARAARHIISLRTGEHADLGIREFAYEIFRAIREVAPAFFADAVERDVPDGPPEVTFTNS
jgi:thymidylate synthase (FAD)